MDAAAVKEGRWALRHFASARDFFELQAWARLIASAIGRTTTEDSAMNMLMAHDFRTAKVTVASLKLVLVPLKYAVEKMLVHKPPQDDQYYVPLAHNPFPMSALEQYPKSGDKKTVIIDFLESFSVEVVHHF